MARRNILRDYSFVWVTLAFFLIALIGHWIAAWYTYVQDQLAHDEPIQAGEYFVQTLRDTLENWQSEFLQLIWQVAGLAFLFYIGSPQSKEGDDRKEEKLDYIIGQLAPQEAENVIRNLDRKYPRK